jgi:hypothetical protein
MAVDNACARDTHCISPHRELRVPPSLAGAASWCRNFRGAVGRVGVLLLAGAVAATLAHAQDESKGRGEGDEPGDRNPIVEIPRNTLDSAPDSGVQAEESIEAGNSGNRNHSLRLDKPV